MIRYFMIRLTALVPKLLIISIIIFLGLEMLPGDALTRTISPEVYSQMNEQQMEQLREALGLNRSLPEKYGSWMGRLLSGDLGYSIVTGSNIRMMLQARLPATLELAGLGLLIATTFGLVLGFMSAVKQNSYLDHSFAAFGVVGISIPEFFLGLCAILVFSIRLQWFPTGGRVAYGHEAFADRLQFLALPALCLGIAYIATLMRFTRSSMLDVLGKDYIKTARSKGLSEFEVNIKHGLRNAIIPVMVILVLRIPMLVSGTLVIENVFNYPGMGSMLISAVSGADMPVVMISTMIISAVILVASFLVDILTAVLDPRIRF